MKKLYCVEIQREMEEQMTHHFYFEGVPTREDVLKEVESLDCGYNDRYGRINWFSLSQ